MPQKIVITGGPGTGKTTLIHLLKQQNYYCFDEVIRSFTAKEQDKTDKIHQVSNPLLFADDPLAFNTQLIESRANDFLIANDLKEDLCFFDRGICDVLAYMNYFKQPYPKKFEKICNTHRYDLVFILPPWREIYKTDEQRLETFTQASAIQQYLTKTYIEFGYEPVTVHFGNAEERVQQILKHLKLI